MAKNFESLFPKELVFGNFLEKSEDFDIVEVGNSEMADTYRDSFFCSASTLSSVMLMI